MKQDRAALEDRDVSIGQPRHLAEGLVREMLGIPSAEWHALDAIGQSGLFQCPPHTYVTHIAPRRLGNPIEGGEDQFDHSASPSVDARAFLQIEQLQRIVPFDKSRSTS